MKPIRTLFAICALALPTGVLLTGCGGDDEAASEDPQTVLDETFDNETTVSSGNLTVSASVSAEGDQGGSFEGSLSGPFQGDPESKATLPQLDLTLSASGEGAGESVDFSGGLVVTEDNAFIEYNDTVYEVGAEAFGQVKAAVESQAGAAEAEGPTPSFSEACTQALEQAGASDTSPCDIDVSSWITNLSNEGTEDVGGSDSVHLSGDANVEQILTDIGELASVFPGASDAGFDPAQLGAFSSAVSEASVDVYSTVDEQLLSKFDINLSIDPSAIAGGAAIPLESIDIDFGFEIGDINEVQTIEAPSDAQPIEDLLGDTGIDLGDLGDLGGGLPGGLPGGSGGGGGGGGGGAGAGAAAEDYLECLNEATTPEEINACASEL